MSNIASAGGVTDCNKKTSTSIAMGMCRVKTIAKTDGSTSCEATMYKNTSAAAHTANMMQYSLSVFDSGMYISSNINEVAAEKRRPNKHCQNERGL